jgi:hypothetical protein
LLLPVFGYLALYLLQVVEVVCFAVGNGLIQNLELVTTGRDLKSLQGVLVDWQFMLELF